MSTDRLADLALAVMCARCEARPNEPCRTISGVEVDSGFHAARIEPVREAYAAGYLQAQTDTETFTG